MKRLLAAAAVLYGLYAVAMISLHPRFIYPFAADRFDAPGYETIVLEGRDVTLAVSDTTGAVAVLYFMGNAGSLAYFAPTLDAHRSAEHRVIALQYRGGGGLSGTPNEETLKADALAAYDWLAATWDGPIMVHGYSLGTGLAVHVAARRDVAGIILDAPYVRLCALMARASYLPACHLPFVQKWNTDRDVAALNAPVLIHHGAQDRLIPPEMGERLSTLMEEAGLDVRFVLVAGATHTNLMTQIGYADRINSFIQRAIQ